MVKPSKKVSDNAGSNPEAEERKRLKNLAVFNNIISDAPARGFTPLTPSKAVVKHHGKDILKKSQRKNRYLFSLPGLLAPINGGGKIGELTNLGSKNPILCLDFPQGRMKLFGTIVYPKNQYLTLQFSKGGKNVTCDDCFDAMIIFSNACWIGRKDENPDEAILDFPKEFYEGEHAECDFQGGAGATAIKDHNFKEVDVQSTKWGSSNSDVDPDSPEKIGRLKSVFDVTPTRHSERTAGKTFNFAEHSSGDDGTDSGSEISGRKEAKEETVRSISKEGLHSDPSGSSYKVGSQKSSGPLVQATISSLFNRVEVKMAAVDPNDPSLQEASGEKLQKMSRHKPKQLKAGEPRKKKKLSLDNRSGSKSTRKRKQDEAEEEDDIEGFSSSSQGSDGSDEDWAG